MSMRHRLNRLIPGVVLAVMVALMGAGHAYADGLTINAVYDSSVTPAEQAVIQSTIGFYESTFSNPITVGITFTAFQPTNNLIGQSQWPGYTPTLYSQFQAALAAASSGDATDTTALANLPATTPTSDGTVYVKPADAAALGLGPSLAAGNIVRLYMDATPTGGCDPTVYYCYNLASVAEHEIDEVLGLGSGAGFGLTLPEDMFRYNAGGQLSFYANGGSGNTGNAYFSLDGTTDLAQFDNQNDGGDFGDWQSQPLPNVAQVQDAWLTPCAYGPAADCTGPTLTRDSTEVKALDAIGYNLQPAETPEPASLWLMGGGVLVLLGLGWRRGVGGARLPG